MFSTVSLTKTTGFVDTEPGRGYVHIFHMHMSKLLINRFPNGKLFGIWNSLPTSIRESRSLPAFTRHFKTIIPRQPI